MARRILKTLVVFLLVILPFAGGILISRFSPYVEGNSIGQYASIVALISAVILAVVVLIVKYFKQSFEQPVLHGIILFCIVSPIIGIIGFAAPPDLSIKMLQHPEREHFRYSLLFLAALLFGLYALFVNRSHSLKLSKPFNWIIIVFFVLALAEMVWEFAHHYLYPEALKAWITEGKKADDFGKYYDNLTLITIGSLGRMIQFTLITWLAIRLYQLRKVNTWTPIVITIFSLLGVISATVILVTEMHIPKGFEILFLFFIPGIPFLLLYWLGVALLTKRLFGR